MTNSDEAPKNVTVVVTPTTVRLREGAKAPQVKVTVRDGQVPTTTGPVSVTDSAKPEK